MERNINFSTDDAVKTAIARMSADSNNFAIGARVNLKNHANVNFDEMSFEDGDVIELPSNEEFNKFVFSQKIGNANAFGVICKVVDNKNNNATNVGKAKRLYFSSLRKNVLAFDQDSNEPRTENGKYVRIHASEDNQYFKMANTVPTIGDVAEGIKGKTLVLTEAPGSPCYIARYANNQIVGTRQTHVWEFNDFFDEAEEVDG